MMKRLCMSQEIRASLGRVPEGLEDLETYFVNAFDCDGRGTLQSESGSFFDNKISFPNHTKLSKIPLDLYSLIRGRDQTRVPYDTAFFQASIKFGRASYSTASSSKGDSYVIYGDYPEGAWFAGQISDIIVQRVDHAQYEVHVAVRHFDRLSRNDSAMDFYLAQQRSGCLGDIGCLFYKRKSAHKTLMDLKDVVCHFMCNPVPVPGVARECIHVRPLFWVSRQ